jgi:hypothetical protein
LILQYQQVERPQIAALRPLNQLPICLRGCQNTPSIHSICQAIRLPGYLLTYPIASQAKSSRSFTLTDRYYTALASHLRST